MCHPVFRAISNTVKEGWLGIVKNEARAFNEQNVAEVEKYLEYVDGTPYKHIPGVTLETYLDPPQMCFRAKRMGGELWGDSYCESYDAHPLCEFSCGNLNDF